MLHMLCDSLAYYAIFKASSATNRFVLNKKCVAPSLHSKIYLHHPRWKHQDNYFQKIYIYIYIKIIFTNACRASHGILWYKKRVLLWVKCLTFLKDNLFSCVLVISNHLKVNPIFLKSNAQPPTHRCQAYRVWIARKQQAIFKRHMTKTMS